MDEAEGDEKEGEKEKGVKISSVLLIFFGVIALISFIFSLISLVYYVAITGSVIGALNKNIYNAAFFLIFLICFIFIEIIVFSMKRGKEDKIKKLIAKAKEEGY